MKIAAHIIERAKAIRIEDEVARRGITLKGKGADRHGPCPVCGGTDQFSIHLKKQLFHCRNCGIGGDLIALVQHLDGCSFTQAVELLTGEQARTPAQQPPAAKKTKQSAADYERERHRTAAWLWSQRKPIIGSIVEHYLRTPRGITCALPATLGFLRATDIYPPALIAAFAIPDEPEPGLLGEPRNVESVQLTRLLPDGSDRERGDDAKIAIGFHDAVPIVLAPPNDLLGLAITEGIEDALTVHQATELGAWAAGSAPFLPKLADVIPSYIECVTIYAHNDENGAGQKNAHQLAQALLRRGIEVFIEGLR